jgi:chemotaxis protein histidine kinase CheA
MNRTTSLQAQFAAVEEQDTEILLEFADEASEQLERIEEALLGVERNPKHRDGLGVAARSLHSLKGAAGYVSLLDIQELCHGAEELLGTFAATYGKEMSLRMDLAFDAVSVLRERISDIRRCCNSRRPLLPSESVTALLLRMKHAVSPRPA